MSLKIVANILEYLEHLEFKLSSTLLGSSLFLYCPLLHRAFPISRFLALASLEFPTPSFKFPFFSKPFFFPFNYIKYWKASILQSSQQQFPFFLWPCNSFEIFHCNCVCHYCYKVLDQLFTICRRYGLTTSWQEAWISWWWEARMVRRNITGTS